MKLPVPKTLMGAVSPMILTSWALGIGIFEYPMGRPRPIISFCWSLANFLIYVIFLWMADLSKIVKLEGSKIAANSYRINAYLCAVFIGTSIYLGRIRTKTVKSTFNKLRNINDKLNILGIPNDYNSFFKSQIIQLGITFVSMLITMILDFEYLRFEFPNRLARLGFIMGSHYFSTFAFVVDCIFTCSIRYFGNRFERLNELLIESDSLEKRETWHPKKLNYRLPRYPIFINEIHRYHSITIRTTGQRWILFVIREARKIHRGLSKTAMELNRAFGIQILFSIAISLGLIIPLFYISYFTVTMSISNCSSEILSLIWIAFYSTKVLLIVEACNTASCEANRTGTLISKLLDLTAGDEDIRDEINIFSLQLIQNPLNFTANGFFSLNYSLIRGMIGSVTTYLVIMIQMRSIYEPENENSIPNSTIPI